MGEPAAVKVRATVGDCRVPENVTAPPPEPVPRPRRASTVTSSPRLTGTPNVMAIRPDGEGDVTKTHVKWQNMVTCPAGSTLIDMAALVHRDFTQGLKSARIWGTGVYDGQTIKRDHVLHDKDIVELHL